MKARDLVELLVLGGIWGASFLFMRVAAPEFGAIPLITARVGIAAIFLTAVLAQRVLEAVFGDQAIRRLAQKAKDDLDARVQALLADELVRYHMILNGLGVESDQSTRLRQAARAVRPAPASRGASSAAARAARR